MPQYFFHSPTFSRLTDADGLQLPNHFAARAGATVTDDKGLVLLKLEMHGYASPTLDASDAL